MDYTNLLEYYEKNKHRKLDSWLSFDGCLKAQGKQGIIGLMERKRKFNIGDDVFYKKRDKNAKILKIIDDSKSFIIKVDGEDNEINTLEEYIEPLCDDPRYIFKLSQYTNHLAYHEMTIMQGLKTISTYCPHFCRGYGVIKTDVEPRFRKVKNPFEIVSKYPIEKEVLLCEYISGSSKFYNYIRSETVKENCLYSIVKQVLLAISIAQKEKQFTHYDLHSNNVMVKKCNKDLVFVYKLDDENQFCVPSMGHIATIIDYGFSYISDMNDSPLYTSLCHTEVGFISDRFDWVADPKLFLVTVSDEIKSKRNTKKAKKLRRIVRNIFAPLKIEWDCGWDNVEKKGAVDYLADMLESRSKISNLFNSFDYYCFDLFQSLIILPLEKQDNSQIKKSYEIFLTEWVKIENEISSEFYNLYILKEIIDTARVVRPDYMRSETRENAILTFKKHLNTSLDKISKFCNPKNLHIEKLLCSMYVFAKNMEGFLYEIVDKQVQRKQKEYDKLMLKSCDEVFAAIDVNIKDDYIYNENTQVLIIDNVLKKNDLFTLSKDEVELINELNPLVRGTFLNDLRKNV